MLKEVPDIACILSHEISRCRARGEIGGGGWCKVLRRDRDFCLGLDVGREIGRGLGAGGGPVKIRG